MNKWYEYFEITFEYEKTNFDFIPVIALYIHKHFNEAKQKWHFHFMIQWLFWYFEIRIGKINK